MGSVIRKFTLTSQPPSGAIHVTQGTEIHWAGPGRSIQDVVATTPSIHMVWGGRQALSVDGRALRIDDQLFLALNAGRALAGRARREPGVAMLSVYFEPRLMLEALEDLPSAHRQALRRWTHDGAVQLFEHLRERDSAIDAVMRYIAHHVCAGVEDRTWCEEQVRFLLVRLLANECALCVSVVGGAGGRAWKRREIFSRLARVTDLIHCAYERELTIAELGEAAHWSVFHLMREFKAVHGVSPHEYLQRRRTQAALHLLRTTDLTVSQAAERVGFQDRSTLMRRLQRCYGLSARAVRDSVSRAAESSQPLLHNTARRATSGEERATSISIVR